MFKLEIDTGNAAFDDDEERPELARILRAISYELERGCDYSEGRKVFDVNGNAVGRVWLDER